MKSVFFTLLIAASPFFVFPQYYSTYKVPIPYKGDRLNMDSVSYQITQIDDNRPDRSLLGTGYYGILNHFTRYTVKSGIPKTFSKFLTKAFKKTKQGNQNILLEFNELSMVEKKEDLGITGGRKRYYGINVTYYLLQNENRVFVMQDSLHIDSISTNSGYFIENFCSDFFRGSLKNLDQSLKTLDVSKAITQQENQSGDEIGNSTKDTTAFKIKANRTFKFKEKTLDPEIKKEIESTYASSVKGNYTVEFRHADLKSSQQSRPITTIKYKKSSISPYIYITLPVLILMRLMSGASSG